MLKTSPLSTYSGKTNSKQGRLYVKQISKPMTRERLLRNFSVEITVRSSIRSTVKGDVIVLVESCPSLYVFRRDSSVKIRCPLQ